MINKIKQFFNDNLDLQTGTDDDAEHRLKLATAVLLIEVTLADFSEDDAERVAVLDALARQFGLDDDELNELVDLAETELKGAVSLYQFTRLINDHYTPAQKNQLMECLWQVAFADGRLDKYEDHLIRTLADLIHVPHADFIRTKLQVQPQP